MKFHFVKENPLRGFIRSDKIANSGVLTSLLRTGRADKPSFEPPQSIEAGLAF